MTRASSAHSSTKNPPRKTARVVYEISSTESSPTKNPSTNYIQTLPSLPIEPTPTLAPQTTTPQIEHSPIEPTPLVTPTTTHLPHPTSIVHPSTSNLLPSTSRLPPPNIFFPLNQSLWIENSTTAHKPWRPLQP
ncbi:hypothetical protein Tco_0060402 [Tanacetum coccineum]